MAESSEKTSPFWNALTLYLAAVLLCTGMYYLVGITLMSSMVILFLILCIGLWLFKIRNTKYEIRNKSKIQISKLEIAVVLLDLILLAVLVANRTDGLLPSPWQTLEPWFFLLVALSTFFLFLAYQKQQPTHYSLLTTTSLHFFLMLSVAAIIYRLGFGFDAFVHRATENWIHEYGFILPKTPYYIGQYGFVVWLAHLTRLPIFYLDVYLVPVLASLTLPATIALTRTTTPYSLLPTHYSFWLIPFVPFLSLHLTTPHTLALLYGILIVLTCLPEKEKAVPAHIPFLLALAALATHPLLGAPLAVFVLASRIKNRLAPALAFVGMALTAPLLFLLNNIRIGAGFPTLLNPVEQLPKFLALFARPYWYVKNAPPLFEALYAWQWMIMLVVIGLAAYGFFLRRNYLPLAGALGLFVSAWLLTSWIIFPDVVSYEQGEYPLRLLKASIIFLLPLAMAGLHAISYKLPATRYKLFAAIAAFLLMLSFYFSYPQRNIKARFPGYNVTAADFTAVAWIHNRHSEYDYTVLSNQLVSAAALTNYSFAKYYDTEKGPLFYYALPTGGELYTYYGKMIYEGQKREYMEEAMNLAGANTAYFVVNSYWANSADIIAGAKQTADSWHEIDDGAVWVFVYSNLSL